MPPQAIEARRGFVAAGRRLRFAPQFLAVPVRIERLDGPGDDARDEITLECHAASHRDSRAEESLEIDNHPSGRVAAGASTPCVVTRRRAEGARRGNPLIRSLVSGQVGADIRASPARLGLRMRNESSYEGATSGDGLRVPLQRWCVDVDEGLVRVHSQRKEVGAQRRRLRRRGEVFTRRKLYGVSVAS